MPSFICPFVRLFVHFLEHSYYLEHMGLYGQLCSQQVQK